MGVLGGVFATVSTLVTVEQQVPAAFYSPCVSATPNTLLLLLVFRGGRWVFRTPDPTRVKVGVH